MNLNQRLKQAAAGIAGGAMMVLIGCAQPPIEQLEAAQKAIDAAKVAGAAEYAKEDLVTLEQQFALAKDELAKQEKAISFVRSYTEADKLLTQVTKAGQQVEAKTAEKKEAAKAAAATMEKEAQQAVASAKQLLASAPPGKERAAVEAIKTNLDGIETALGTVHRLIEQGNYIEAETRARALTGQGTAVSEEIRNAFDKAKGKKSTTHAKPAPVLDGSTSWTQKQPSRVTDPNV